MESLKSLVMRNSKLAGMATAGAGVVGTAVFVRYALYWRHTLYLSDKRRKATEERERNVSTVRSQLQVTLHYNHESGLQLQAERDIISHYKHGDKSTVLRLRIDQYYITNKHTLCLQYNKHVCTCFKQTVGVVNYIFST